MRTALAITIGLLATLLLIVGLDRAAGAYLYATRKNTGLIWAPDSTVEHSTVEFHYSTHINNLGFRGADLNRARTGKIRIAIIGDSFTYGWGLEIGQTWPKLLEASLRNTEIANLGEPGAGPLSYAELAPRALAELHPDVLIIAVVQADDVVQCSDQPPDTARTWRQRLGNRLAAVIPGLATIAGLTPSAKLHVTAEDLRAIWKRQAHDFINGFSSAERAKFDTLPQRTRDLYTQGDINPGIIFYAFRRPRFLVDSANPEKPSTKAELQQLTRMFAEIRRAAEGYRTRTLVVSVPYRSYASARDMEAMREFGFEVDPSLLRSSKPDDVIRDAANHAGLSVIAVTPQFRAVAQEQDLYFPLDGHFNAAGARTFAGLLSPQLAAYVKK